MRRPVRSRASQPGICSSEQQRDSVSKRQKVKTEHNRYTIQYIHAPPLKHMCRYHFFFLETNVHSHYMGWQGKRIKTLLDQSVYNFLYIQEKKKASKSPTCVQAFLFTFQLLFLIMCMYSNIYIHIYSLFVHIYTHIHIYMLMSLLFTAAYI